MGCGDRRAANSDISQPDYSDCEGPPRHSRGPANQVQRGRTTKVRTFNRWSPEEHERLAYLVQKWGSEKNSSQFELGQGRRGDA
jgi:hypothetical protein